jgi:hypothetical protein
MLQLSISDNIGQMSIETADKEIKRLKEQGNGDYVKDFTPQLYCYDETDDNVYNPCNLSIGNCWVIRKQFSLNPNPVNIVGR